MTFSPTSCFVPAARGTGSSAACNQAAAARYAWMSHALLAIIALNMLDLSLSLITHRSNLLTSDTEQNPIAAGVLGDGSAALSNYKLGLVAAGVTGLFLCRRTRLAYAGVIVLLGVYLFVALYWLGWLAVIAHDGYGWLALTGVDVGGSP
jgi:hypothetical protein